MKNISIAIDGPSGAGKSTLFYQITFQKSSGKIKGVARKTDNSLCFNNISRGASSSRN